jgi:hypothetical protein
MRAIPLFGDQAIWQAGATHFFDLDFTDLTSGTNVQTIPILTNRQNTTGFRVISCQLLTPFVSSDGTLISTAISVGDAGLVTRDLISTELNAAGPPITNRSGVASVPLVDTSDTVKIVTVTATAAKVLSTHTAGRARIFLQFLDDRIP